MAKSFQDVLDEYLREIEDKKEQRRKKEGLSKYYDSLNEDERRKLIRNLSVDTLKRLSEQVRENEIPTPFEVARKGYKKYQ